MAVYKRGNVYYVDKQLKGIRYKRAIPEARTKKQAELVEAQLIQSVFDGTFGRESQSILFEKFIADVYTPHARENKRSWSQETYKLKLFCDFFKGKQMRDISPMLIEKYKRTRAAGHTKLGRLRSPATVNLELAILSRIFTMAIENNLMASNPAARKVVKRYKVNNKRGRTLSDEEEENLMAQLTGRRAYLRPIVHFALHTGFRRSAIIKLEWRDLDFEAGTIHLRAINNKSKKDLIVPMSVAVRASLLEVRSLSDGEGKVFAYESGMSLSSTHGAFRNACRDAGIENFRFHDLRHSFASRLPPDPYLRRDLLGHASIEQSADYSHTTMADLRRAVDGLSAPKCPKSVPSGLKVVGSKAS